MTKPRPMVSLTSAIGHCALASASSTSADARAMCLAGRRAFARDLDVLKAVVRAMARALSVAMEDMVLRTV